MRFAVLKGRGTVHQLLLFQLLAGKVKHSPLSNEIKSAIALIIYTFFTLNHKQIQSLLFCSDDRISKYYSLLDTILKRFDISCFRNRKCDRAATSLSKQPLLIVSIC